MHVFVFRVHVFCPPSACGEVPFLLFPVLEFFSARFGVHCFCLLFYVIASRVPAGRCSSCYFWSRTCVWLCVVCILCGYPFIYVMSFVMPIQFFLCIVCFMSLYVVYVHYVFYLVVCSLCLLCIVCIVYVCYVLWALCTVLNDSVVLCCALSFYVV